MQQCIVIPDSFKGSISAIEFCSIATECIKETFPSCRVTAIPVADGGEGTVDCFLFLKKYKKINLVVTDAFGSPINVYYARKDITAIIELAMCAGLPLAQGRANPGITTTYGVGEMILHAIEHGCTNIILGLGGSCTNDMGTGMAAALKTKFYDYDGKDFIPVGVSLNKINKIDTSQTAALLQGVTVTALCDINNPLYGSNGAAYVFAPQKGADSAMVEILNENLKSGALAVNAQLDIDVNLVPGAGAAGGVGAGVIAFLNGSLQSGIDFVLNTVHFTQLLKNTDMVFTGEGKLDQQSLGGKAVIGIAQKAQAQNVPVIAVVGDVQLEFEEYQSKGVSCAFSTNLRPLPFPQVMPYAKQNLKAVFKNILTCIKASQNL